MVKNDFLQILDIQKHYGDRHVLKSVNLNIEKGEFIAIVGKSGCGKSTLLRLLSGLEKPSGGQILIDGKRLESLNRKACMVFQDGHLLPWKRVIDNIELGLKGNHKQKAIEVLKHVGLENYLYEWPAKLSGGQKQRVALARALMHQPKLLLLDEPLGALDALTRLEMQNLIEEIRKLNNFTALLVTHDVEEAVALADRVVLLQDGCIAQDVPIQLPRPRQRDREAFAAIVNQIRNRIMGITENMPPSNRNILHKSYSIHSIPGTN
ncbi:ATP-binding cassette domain-containing protein [Heyndrickxia acidiproducens]|uniref:ATP-binding cassette domain-containing protein n=1 Tax=Heyndrickxia acidiproducens TaxID=1121084 RepID=UPI0003820631|nr:ATP-binding cassette domain-containing protein [Heyndrickxia acidiproducens]